MSALTLMSDGWLSSVEYPALTLMTNGWLYEYMQPYVPPVVPPAKGDRRRRFGGSVPLYAGVPETSFAQPEDEARRARTLVAAIGVSMEDGDEADRLAATIGLLLSRGLDDRD